MKGDIRNKAGIARLFGVSVKVVERWIAEGMPVVSAPSNRNGEYRIDTAAAWQWHLERLAASDGELDLNAELRASLLPADEVAEAWKEAQAMVHRTCAEMVIDAVPKLLAAIRSAATPEQAELASRKILTKSIDDALNALTNANFEDDEDEAA